MEHEAKIDLNENKNENKTAYLFFNTIVTVVRCGWLKGKQTNSVLCESNGGNEIYNDNKRYKVNDQQQWVHATAAQKMCNDTKSTENCLWRIFFPPFLSLSLSLRRFFFLLFVFMRHVSYLEQFYCMAQHEKLRQT